MYRETFRCQQADESAVIAHFSPALRDAASGLCAGESVQAILSEEFRKRLIEALRKAAATVAFSSGLELLAPFSADVTSPTFEQEQLQQMQRTAAQRQSADRLEHFEKAAELLQHWERLRTSTPSLTPGRLLDQIAAGDRATILQNLLMASATRGEQPDLLAVAGPFLVRIDLRHDAPQPTLTPLPTTAGPLRSVRGELIGAQSGVLHIDESEVVRTYRDPQLNSEHGFTAAVCIGDEIWACHRDGGIVAWKTADLDNPMRTIRPGEIGGMPRCLLAAREHLLLAVDHRLMQISEGRMRVVSESTANIVAVLDCDGRIAAVSEDGTVSLHEWPTLERTSTLRPAGQICGASLLPWLDSHRLLLSTADGPIYSVGLDDQLVMQYLGLQTGACALAASAGKLAAMAADRQRVILWNTWDGRQPAGEIHLGAIARHRIADIGFA